jgi:hypothetical protein
MVGQIADFCVAASASSTFIILSAAVVVVSCLKSRTRQGRNCPCGFPSHSPGGGWCGVVCLLSAIGNLLSVGHQFFSFHFPLCGFLSEVAPGKADRGRTWKQAVINPGVGGVLRVLQFLQREVGRDDQRLAAAVTAVNHIVNLFQPVFCAALHAEIVKDQQRIAAKAGNIFVPALKAGGKVIEYKVAKFVMQTGISFSMRAFAIQPAR